MPKTKSPQSVSHSPSHRLESLLPWEERMAVGRGGEVEVIYRWWFCMIGL